MSHTPRLLHVIEQNERDKDARCVRLVDSNGVFALVIDEKYGERFAALWNMAERLGLSTEAIEGGVIDDMLKMLTELQECAEYWSEYDVPLGIKERLDEVIKKARGDNA